MRAAVEIELACALGRPTTAALGELIVPYIQAAERDAIEREAKVAEEMLVPETAQPVAKAIRRKTA